MITINVIRVFCTVTLLVYSAQADAQPCSDETSVNITDGTMSNYGTIEYDGVEYLPGEYFQVESDYGGFETWGCVCLKKACVRKCCPIGEAYSVLGICEESVNPFNPKTYNLTDELYEFRAQDQFYTLHEEPNADWVLINPFANTNDSFYLQENGHLYLPNFNSRLKDYNLSTYCLEAFTKDPVSQDANWSTQYMAVVHVKLQEIVNEGSNEENTHYMIFYRIGLIISIVFLLATFLVYAFTPSLRNLHGKALMSYVFGLGMAFILTLLLQQEKQFSSRLRCYLLTFPNYYFIMASFFWLNIMCFDIWLTFGARILRRAKKESEARRFWFYSLHGWGAPGVLTAVSALLHFHDGFPATIIRPQIAEARCWFSEKAELVYVYVPILILVVCNLFMFASTTFKILRVKQETQMLKGKDNSRSTQYKKDTQRFSIYLKLFLVMGVTWTTELLSFYLGGSIWIWIFTDIINTLLGVYIFFIFVWKKKVKKLLFERYHDMPLAPLPRKPSTLAGSSCRHGIKNFAMEQDLRRARRESLRIPGPTPPAVPPL